MHTDGAVFADALLWLIKCHRNCHLVGAVAASNRLQTRCPLSHYTSMFDPVQAPSLRHAFELVNAAILEADSRLRHQVLDRARDQDFAGTRFRGDARADVKRETDRQPHSL